MYTCDYWKQRTFRTIISPFSSNTPLGSAFSSHFWMKCGTTQVETSSTFYFVDENYARWPMFIEQTDILNMLCTNQLSKAHDTKRKKVGVFFQLLKIFTDCFIQLYNTYGKMSRI